MKAHLLAAVLAMSAVPATAQSIDVGHANWDKFPRLKTADRRLPYDLLVGKVEQMLASDQCQLQGQSPRKFDIVVPYAVLLDEQGRASRIVVNDLGCPPLETMVGTLVADMSRLGDFTGGAPEKPRWYASVINFTLQ
jgi:hypothetical protein